MEPPMVNGGSGVCVIIAARNAAGTIGRAIDSALAQTEVLEVIVVDDASSDGTAEISRARSDATGRLRVHRLDENVGPSAARNLAIAQSVAPFIAILDADDFFLPGRFAALLGAGDWDMIADNIVFVDESRANDIDLDSVAAHQVAPRQLSIAEFVEGSISRRGRYKGELGFLKPIFSRAFLDRHELRYTEEMRLSEDYDLYLRAMFAGARFRIVAGCYYVAVELSGSLSSRHGWQELALVHQAVGRLRDLAPRDNARLWHQLNRQFAQTDRKWRHRAVLSRKRDIGTWRALIEIAWRPKQLAGVLIDTARDKLNALRPVKSVTTSTPNELRFLLSTHEPS